MTTYNHPFGLIRMVPQKACPRGRYRERGDSKRQTQQHTSGGKGRGGSSGQVIHQMPFVSSVLGDILSALHGTTEADAFRRWWIYPTRLGKMMKKESPTKMRSAFIIFSAAVSVHPIYRRLEKCSKLKPQALQALGPWVVRLHNMVEDLKGSIRVC